MGMQRTILTEQARQNQKGQGEPDAPQADALAGAVIAVMIWPALVAATVEHEGFEHWPVSSDELMDLPEAFVTEWEQAVYSLNPHWRIGETASAEKKAENG